MAEIVLVRHGQTEWSATGRHTSYTDIPLTADGERQAQLLGKALAGRGFVAVLSTPRRQARETAELAGLPVTETVDDLVERDYGDDEGVTTKRIRAARQERQLWRGSCPDGGSP